MRKISTSVIHEQCPQFIVSIEGSVNIKTPIRFQLVDNSQGDASSSLVDTINAVLVKNGHEVMGEDEIDFVIKGPYYE